MGYHYNHFFNEVFDSIIRMFCIEPTELVKASKNSLTLGSIENWRSTTRSGPTDSSYKLLRESIKIVIAEKLETKETFSVIRSFDKIMQGWEINDEQFDGYNKLNLAILDYIIEVLDFAFENKKVERKKDLPFYLDEVSVVYKHNNDGSYQLDKRYKLFPITQTQSFIVEQFNWHISSSMVISILPAVCGQKIEKSTISRGWHKFNIVFEKPCEIGDYVESGFLLRNLIPAETPSPHLSIEINKEHKLLSLKKIFNHKDIVPKCYKLYREINGNEEVLKRVNLREDQREICEVIVNPELGYEYGIDWGEE